LAISLAKRRAPRTYFIECASCHASAQVALETVMPATGGLRCLACGGSHVIVQKRRHLPCARDASAGNGPALKP
jgi:hypothetical protein